MTEIDDVPDVFVTRRLKCDRCDVIDTHTMKFDHTPDDHEVGKRLEAWGRMKGWAITPEEDVCPPCANDADIDV